MKDITIAEQGTPIKKKGLPKDLSVLIVGIHSIFLAFFYALPGIVTGIIALAQSKEALEAYEMEPERYKEGSYKMVKSGRTCAIIGTILSVVMLFVFILFFYFIFSLQDVRHY